MSLWLSLRRALGLAPRPTRSGPPAGLARTASASGSRRVSYSPRRNGSADPGEVVWVSVAFEDEPHATKDRPVLVVGRDGRDKVLGLLLSTQSKRAQENGWLPLGRGPWDAQGRDSFVRLDRVLELRADSIRREGAALDKARFEYVSNALRARHGWT